MNWECCWAKENIVAEDCPYVTDNEAQLRSNLKQRVVEKCVECPRFRSDLRKLKEVGYPLSSILPHILDKFMDQKGQIESMMSFLDSKTQEINFLHELVVVLQTSMNLDEVLSIAMTAITAGKGFGLNRAFLLLVDKERKYLNGYLGVGPRTYEEAWQSWEEIDRNDFTLNDMARNFFDTKLSIEKVKFHDILDRLSIPLDDENHIMNKALLERKPFLVENAHENPDVDVVLREVLGSTSFIIMPLISRSRRIGVIIADNYFTRKPISQGDLQSMETFALPVAFAIERASLYERLQEEVDKLTVANVKLKEQQELIVKMEKMALVGKITSNIAHSIRNPLMIIGGFARSLLKSISVDDPKKEYLESIVSEAKQLEEVLAEVLTYSDSLYPTMDSWDVNQLLTTVCTGLSDKLQKGKNRCNLDLSADLPTAFLDYKQVAYCIRTLISNLFEAMPDGGEIGIKTTLADENIILEMCDTSKARSKGEHESTGYLPFSTQELGSGLGLSLCTTIFEKNDIPFSMEYLAGSGVKFTIKLPVKKEA